MIDIVGNAKDVKPRIAVVGDTNEVKPRIDTIADVALTVRNNR